MMPRTISPIISLMRAASSSVTFDMKSPIIVPRFRKKSLMDVNISPRTGSASLKPSMIQITSVLIHSPTLGNSALMPPRGFSTPMKNSFIRSLTDPIQTHRSSSGANASLIFSRSPVKPSSLILMRTSLKFSRDLIAGATYLS